MIWLLACAGPAPSDSPAIPDSPVDSDVEAIPEACAEMAARTELSDLVEDLEAVRQVQVGWREVGPAVVVERLGDTTCLFAEGAWATTPDEAVLLLPYFGYHFGADAPTREAFAGLYEVAAQPPGVVQALQDLGIDRAPLLPVAAEGLDRAQRLYMATHEGFHVHAQSQAWFGQPDAAPWPSWDEPPERSALPSACYDDLADERAALNQAVAAARSGEDPCPATREFLALRATRQDALDDVTVGTSGLGCRESEALMEIEEGIPDGFAWSLSTAAGIQTEADLKTYLGAQTDDAYYPMGAAQLLVLDTRVGAAAVRDALAASPSWETGHLGAQLSDTCH